MATETHVRPLMISGDLLTQPEFHRLYHLMPSHVRARLIEGIVFIEEDDNGMASPASWIHAEGCGLVGSWLGAYRYRTKHLRLMDNGTLILGPQNEPQPDFMLFIDPASGGCVSLDGAFARGVPELVIVVAVSSKAVDLGTQRVAYQNAGITEYIVFASQSRELSWHTLQEGQLILRPPDADGIYRSQAFPGLWLQSTALWDDDGDALFQTLERGLASPEYAAFVAELHTAHSAEG